MQYDDVEEVAMDQSSETKTLELTDNVCYNLTKTVVSLVSKEQQPTKLLGRKKFDTEGLPEKGKLAVRWTSYPDCDTCFHKKLPDRGGLRRPDSLNDCGVHVILNLNFHFVSPPEGNTQLSYKGSKVLRDQLAKMFTDGDTSHLDDCLDE